MDLEGFDRLPERVTVYEVGPRDGLQSEQRMVPTADKIAFVDALSDTGLRYIEVTSFVDPRWIPQMVDAAAVAAGIHRRPGVTYSCLVPNRRGLDAALAAGMEEVAVFMSASETHNQKNVNKTIAQTLQAFEGVMGPAQAAGVRVRAYLSTVFGCPYEGRVDPRAVMRLVGELRGLGAYQVSLGDTTGMGRPPWVHRVLEVLLEEVPPETLALHFHGTREQVLTNVLVGLDLGISTVDSALGGLGGCPYAPGAPGNLATEDLVDMLQGRSIETGVDLDALRRIRLPRPAQESPALRA
jgi:hydroxymethylglutaryl-CoA lyase